MSPESADAISREDIPVSKGELVQMIGEVESSKLSVQDAIKDYRAKQDALIDAARENRDAFDELDHEE